MFFYEGMVCPVCERPFVSTDDIVACPHCGLPHHRVCWQRTGECHLRHLHNTPEQWTRNRNEDNTPQSPSNVSNAQACLRCGAENPEFAEYCKRCGNMLPNKEWHSSSGSSSFEYTPFTAVDSDSYTYPDSDCIEKIPTKSYASVVGIKADYYIPRFKRLAAGGHGGWNWSAFLFGPYWLLYRKMYGGGALLMLLQLLETIINGYVLRQLGVTTLEQLYSAFQLPVQNRTYVFYLLSIWIMSVIMLLLRVTIGLAGNSFYKQHCLKQIKRSRERVPDISAAELSTIGGTTLGVALIGYFVLYFLTQMVTIFFM